MSATAEKRIDRQREEGDLQLTRAAPEALAEALIRPPEVCAGPTRAKARVRS